MTFPNLQNACLTTFSSSSYLAPLCRLTITLWLLALASCPLSPGRGLDTSFTDISLLSSSVSFSVLHLLLQLVPG